MLRDLALAIRLLHKRPGSAAGIVLTLALGLGGVTTVFAIIRASLVRPVPFEESDRLVMLYVSARQREGVVRARWAYPEVRALREAAGSFDAIASFSSEGVNLGGIGLPQHAGAEFVSRSYFDLLRVRPQLGRLPAGKAEMPGQPAAVLVSHALWQRDLGAAPSALGRAIRINGMPLTIAGVLPRGFRGLSGQADVWIPETMGPALSFREYLTSGEHFHNVVARLRPGATLESAQAELRAIGPRMKAALGEGAAGVEVLGAIAVPLNEARVDRAGARARWLLFGAATLLLLLALANLANLFGSRVAARQREVAVRLALGCGPWRLLRAFWTETLVLGVTGALASLLVGAWASTWLAAISPARLPTPANDYLQLASFADVEVDRYVAAFAVSLMLVCTLVISLVGLRSVVRPDLSALLRRATRAASAWRVRGRTGSVLVSLQAAMAVTLVTGAVLMLEELSRIRAVDPGFRPERVLTFTVQQPQPFDRPGEGPRLVEGLIARLSLLPGVEAVTTGQCTPFDARCARLGLAIIGRSRLGDPNIPIVGWHRVGPDHFRALGIPVRRGRGFTPSDRVGHPAIVAINEAAARRFWPDQDPLGQRIQLPATLPGSTETTAEVVGIVGDVIYWPLDAPPGPDVYQPALQFSYGWTNVMVRLHADPLDSVRALRVAIAESYPDLPAFDVATLEEKAARGRSEQRFLSVLLATFGALGLALAAVGVHSVTAWWVAAQRRELGIRLALGATPAGVVLALVSQVMSRVGVGVALGILLALSERRLLGALVRMIEPRSATATAIAVAVVLVSGLAASCAPARRVMTVNPVEELRVE